MKVVRFGALRVVAAPGVYVPRSDTELLASQLGDVQGAHVLELCAGSGALAQTAAARGAARVVAVDCSARAVLSIRAGARLNGLKVDARRGDLLGALDRDERFDVILANPPYLPADPDAPRTDDRWDAGADGREVLDRIADGAHRHLRPGGRVLLVQSEFAGGAETERRLKAAGLELTDRVEHRGPLGPIAAARRGHLIRRGVMAPGDEHETMLVIGARLQAPMSEALAAA